MGLSWNTYHALPTLYNYAAAEKWEQNVKPIRGDARGTKPLGRRDQKWRGIYRAEDGSIRVNEGYDYEAMRKIESVKERMEANNYRYAPQDLVPQDLITFHKSGVVEVSVKYSSATLNEVFGSVLSMRVRTHQYDSWVNCSWYDSGELRSGWMPLHKTKPNLFMRDGRDGRNERNHRWVFLNYTYPTNRKINREGAKAIKARYAPALDYIANMEKLMGKSLSFDNETRGEVWGWKTHPGGNRGPDIPPQPAAVRWAVAEEKARTASNMFTLLESTDTQDHFKLLVWLTCGWMPPTDSLTDFLRRQFKDQWFTEERVTSGALVTDKYRRFFLW